MYGKIFTNVGLDMVLVLLDNQCLLIAGKATVSLHIQKQKSIQLVTKQEYIPIAPKHNFEREDDVECLDVIDLDSKSADPVVLKNNIKKSALSGGYSNIYELISHIPNSEYYSNILIWLNKRFYLVKPEFFSQNCFLIRSTPYPQYQLGVLSRTAEFHTNSLGTLILRGGIYPHYLSRSKLQIRVTPAIKIADQKPKKLLLKILKDEGNSLLPEPLTSTEKLNKALLTMNKQFGPYADIVTLYIDKKYWLINASVLAKSSLTRQNILLVSPDETI